MSDLIIFGCGYIGSRVARAALAQGRRVRCCTRSVAKLAPLKELGAELHFIDAAKPRQFGPALAGLHAPTVLYALPPIPDMPGGEIPRRATQASITANVQSFVFLSSAGIYGSTASEEWIDETTAASLDDPAMQGYLSEEAAVSAAASAGLRTVTLRLPAVYGPGRGVRARMRKGEYTLADEGRHWFSRIHVDDLVQIVFAAEEKAPAGAVYLLSDDKPTQQKEHAAWIAEHLKMPMPRSIPSMAPGTSRTPIRGRRIRNDVMKKELGVALKYPTYVEGELQIDAEEAGTAPVAAPAPTPAPAAAAPAPKPSPAGRPDWIRRVSEGELTSNARIIVLATGKSFTAGDRESVFIMDGAPDTAEHRLGPGDLLSGGREIVNRGASDARLLVVK